VSVGALIAGILGMNLKNHHEWEENSALGLF
jgi:hypothetical protein